MQRVHGRLGLIAAAGMLVGACGTTATATPTPLPATPSRLPTPTVIPMPATPTPVPSPVPATLPVTTAVPTPGTSLPPFACGTTVGRPGTVPVARITGMSAANDASVGRITITFAGDGAAEALPEVEVRPAEPPFVQDPSDLPLEVAGSSFVSIVLTGGTALDADFNPTYAGPFDFRPGGSPIVEMARAGDFEAVSSFVVGLDGPPCVRIVPPDGSSRLVIELRSGPGA